MTKRNIIAIITGSAIGLFPVFINIFYNPIFQIGRIISPYFGPILGSLIAEGLYFLIIGLAVYFISQPKMYLLIPPIGVFLGVAVTFNAWEGVLSGISVFISFMVSSSIGYSIPKFLGRSHAQVNLPN